MAARGVWARAAAVVSIQARTNKDGAAKKESKKVSGMIFDWPLVKIGMNKDML